MLKQHGLQRLAPRELHDQRKRMPTYAPARGLLATCCTCRHLQWRELCVFQVGGATPALLARAHTRVPECRAAHAALVAAALLTRDVHYRPRTHQPGWVYSLSFPPEPVPLSTCTPWTHHAASSALTA